MKALVIHDREDISEKIAALLMECGCDRADIIVAEDVRSATEELRTQMFDIAIIIPNGNPPHPG